MPDEFDVVVVGAGNAGICAALSAHEMGARVLVLERAPREERGGNSYFTGGSFRFPYDDARGLAAVVEIGDDTLASIDVSRYNEQDFYDDLCRVTNYRCDPDLSLRLVGEAMDGMIWLRRHGVRFEMQFARQSFKQGARHRFWGGSIVAAIGGGAGLVDSLFGIVEKKGIDVWYGARGRQLRIGDDGAICGIHVNRAGDDDCISCKSVVLAAGGFEANPKWRAAYLGPGWDLAKVRGTRFNTGDGIQMALDIGAQPFGHWSGCHAVGWDLNAPPYGEREIGDLFNKHSYPFGIMVNKLGRRFVDEGADMRNYTYAKYGREILNQPDQVAHQIFDQKVINLLRDEYRIRKVTKAEANTVEELAGKLEIPAAALTETITSFNAAVADTEFNPAIKDGKGTRGINPPKSNWAQRIDSPPFVAFSVTCGITYTFGGLAITPDARVLDTEGRVIPRLYACGELVGGLFYNNYPGGSGLMAGAVFGRHAGRNAAACKSETLQ